MPKRMGTDASNRLVRVLLLAMLAACSCAPGEPPRRPNVVVILLDTLRPDYLSFYGYEKEKAPFLARLAKESVVFERAFSTSHPGPRPVRRRSLHPSTPYSMGSSGVS